MTQLFDYPSNSPCNIPIAIKTGKISDIGQEIKGRDRWISRNLLVHVIHCIIHGVINGKKSRTTRTWITRWGVLSRVLSVGRQCTAWERAELVYGSEAFGVQRLNDSGSREVASAALHEPERAGFVYHNKFRVFGGRFLWKAIKAPETNVAVALFTFGFRHFAKIRRKSYFTQAGEGFVSRDGPASVPLLRGINFAVLA